MADRLKDRVAIITGSGQGIGRAIAIGMAKEGAKVVTNNRKPGSSGGDAETVAREIMAKGGQALSFFGDVSRFEVAGEIVQAAIDKFGRLDILVNNAGISEPRAIWEMTEEEWDRVIGVCLKGAFNCTRFACNMMKEQKWGRIINCTSASSAGSLELANYCAAKAGVIGLTKAVALDMGRYGVTCNAYAPQASTRMVKELAAKGVYQRRLESGWMRKEGNEWLFSEQHVRSAEAAAPLTVYLATEEAADINGTVFFAGGGEVSIYSESVRKERIYRKETEGFWTVDELIELVPKVLLKEYKNPAPSTPKVTLTR